MTEGTERFEPPTALAVHFVGKLLASGVVALVT